MKGKKYYAAALAALAVSIWGGTSALAAYDENLNVIHWIPL